MSSTVGRLVVSVLTNKRGSGVNYGDLVYIDTANADAFTVGTTNAYTGMVGVCIEKNGIANNATGRIQTQGLCAQVNLNASGTLGHYVKTYTVAAQATDAGASRVVGAFGQIMTGGTSTPDVLLFGFPDAASSSAAAGTPGLTLSTTNSAGAASTFVATDATVAVFDSTAPVTQALGDTAAAGSAGVTARRDHKHGMPATTAVPGGELDFVQKTSSTTLAAATEATATTILTSNSTTFDGAAVIATFYSPGITTNATTNADVSIILHDDTGAAVLGTLIYHQSQAATANYVPSFAQYRFTPAAGARTYSVRGFSATNSPVVLGGAGGAGNFMPAFLRFTKV